MKKKATKKATNEAKSKSKGTFTICSECGSQLDFGSYPFCPHGQTGSRYAQRIDPIVVFRKSDGTYSIPGANWTRTPKGCQRVELRTLREVRAVEREINGHTAREYEQKLEGRRANLLAARSQSRSELREAMKRMSPQGRKFAELAMERTDRREANRRIEMPTAFFHVSEYDSSNREKQRDESTGWKRRDA